MNFISWNNRLINEDTATYFSEEILEESISKTLKPVMNKMKKLNIGLPYRDARLFFFQFLKEKHPELIPASMGSKKPSAKDVNALVGQIAIEKPDAIEKFGEEFEKYSTEKVQGTDEDRVSQFLRVAMILRSGKGVRPKGTDEGFVKKEYSGLTAQKIKDTTMDAIEKTPVDKGKDPDIKDEKLLLKASFAKVLAQLEQMEEINPKVLENIINVGSKIDTIAKFRKFLDYMHQYEEYHIAEEYLRDMLGVVEKTVSEMGEDEEQFDDFDIGPAVEELPELADFESMMDGKFPSTTHTAEESKMTLRAAEKLAQALSQVEGQKFSITDGSIEPKHFDLDTEKEGKFAGGSYNITDDGSIVNVALPTNPVYGFVNDSIEDLIETIRKLDLVASKEISEDDNDEYAPADAPEDDQMGEMEPDEDAEVDVKKSDLNKDGKLSEYEKARGQAIADAMEKDKDEEEEDDRISSYLKLQKAKDNMPKIKAIEDHLKQSPLGRVIGDESKAKDMKDSKEEDAERCPVTGKLRKKKEEEEEMALSPQEINRRMHSQRMSELQNYYHQERLNRWGY